MSRITLIASVIFTLLSGIHGGGYYTIIAPKSIRPFSEYHVSMAGYDLTEPINVRLTINGTKYDDETFSYLKTQEVLLENNSQKTVQFDIEDLPDGNYRLIANGLSGLIFENETYLTHNSKSFSVLVQSDKAIYKPADTIRFRVLVLDSNTRPYNYKSPLNVFIVDGKGNRVKQWLDVKTIKGVFTGELQLSDAPVLGDWKIQVEVQGNTQTKVVEVAEYVLPKFEVTVQAEPHAVYKDGKIKATIRSTYTYGKPVKGEATISAYPTLYIGSLQPFVNNVIARKVVPIDGKATVEFDIKDELKLENDYERDVIIEAVVEEELTGRKQNGTGKSTLHQYRQTIELIKDDDNYKPGLPFNAYVKIANHDGSPVQDSNNPVIVTTSFYWGDDKESNKSYTLDANGMARIDLTIPEDAVTLSIRATYLGQTSWIGHISQAKSNSKSYLRTKVLNQRPEINADVNVNVQTTEVVSELKYIVLGRGDIIQAGTVQSPAGKDHSFKFLGTFAMVPRAQLVVFYVRPDGEMVSDRVELEFGADLQNFVKLQLSTQRAGPGQDIAITVNTKPNSYVGLLGVDQSVLLLKKGNDLSKDEVFEELQQYDGNGYRSWRPRWKRSYIPYWQQDRFESFDDAGMAILTNTIGNKEPRDFTATNSPGYDPDLARKGKNSKLYDGGKSFKFTTVKTDIGPPRLRVFATRPPLAGPFAFSRIPKPRWNRPRVHVPHEIQNTWLFLNANSGFDGTTVLNKKVPDTITKWVITAFSVDPVTGLGLTQRPRELEVFQPFFVSLNLPYSVKREEIVSIPIVVFNYMEGDQTAEVTLHNAENEFEFVEPTNEIEEEPKVEPFRKKRMTVKSNSGSSTSFLIRPKKAGHITIKVTAQGNSAGDGVERQLLVVPEGVPQYINEAILVDLREKPDFFKNLTIQIPKNAVPDSTRVEVTVVGDLLGPTIKNLDKLIKMPYGCGEQNMLNFVPNIVVLEYLTTIGLLTPEIESKAKKFMESGYQRELTYKHSDGSFSAFGESDASGSTWLTAFVARSFRQAAKHIDIEESIIKDALTFLADKQAVDGSFPEVGKVSHSAMQGGAGKGLPLTAYTLITFLENKEQFPEFQNAINKATDYLVRNLENLDDLYGIALVAYALQLLGHNAKDFVLTRLDSRATNDGGLKYWHKDIPETDKKNPWYYKPNSVNVEMTSYALLAFVEARQEAAAFPILKWLVGQRNEEGGFQSTQDTVIGLQALARLATKVYSPNSNVQIKVSYGGDKEANLKVDRDNAFVLQSYLLPADVREVNISASGAGIAIAQLSYKYHVNVTAEWPRFVLDPQVNRNSNKDYLHLTVCTNYVPLDGDEQSNMAVMEIEFPSGFTADSDSLPSLESYENVKKVETKNGDTNVVLYFDSLDRKGSCPTVSAFRTHKVANQKPAAVRVYDYYDNSRQARMFYHVEASSACDICEGEECAEKCAPKAQPQVSQKQEVDPQQTTNGNAVFAPSSSPSVAIPSMITLIIASLLRKMF